jgi:DNA topoisomerase-1
MMLAQQLYEGIELGNGQAEGLITYMRTDSQNLSTKFITEARDYIKENWGNDYLPSETKIYKTKSKNAQEAHEAIRPTEARLDPEAVKAYLNPKQDKLYRLIWTRSVETQMKNATIAVTTIVINSENNQYEFTASGAVIKFPGYLKIYNNFKDSEVLPACQTGEKLEVEEINGEQHFTKPPARYSDAGLVKELEKRGIGRPSTYAPIISTILARNYVTREEKRLKPTEIGTMVTELLVQHFQQVIDYDFTAKMEESLDEISTGEKVWQPVIAEFYQPFAENLDKKYRRVTKESMVETTDEVCEKCGSPMVIKMAKYGKFLACSNFPTCRNTKNFNGSGEIEAPETIDETCPECGAGLQVKIGRFGKFIACSNYPKCKFTKQLIQETGVTCPSCQKRKNCR